MLAYVFMMIIYMTVLMYGIYVMRGVLEEKSSHIVEVMISTVKPFELMLGKILGIGAVGLTQFICGRLMAVVSAPGMPVAVGISGMELPRFRLQLLFFFVIYFVLGFLLYGTLYAGIGAAFDTEQEAQNFQVAITILPGRADGADDADPQPAGRHPGGGAVADPVLHADADVPAHDPDPGAGNPTRRLGGTDGGDDPRLTWVVGKIYRVGILMHGSKPKLKDLIRWVREA